MSNKLGFRQICCSCLKEFYDLTYVEANRFQLLKGTYCDQCLKKELHNSLIAFYEISEVARLINSVGTFPKNFSVEAWERLPEYHKETYRKYAPKINKIRELIDSIQS